MIHNHAGRGLKAFALMTVLGLSVVGLSQCRLVEDNVTGVELNTSESVNARAKCVQTCNDKYKAAERTETTRNKAAVKACGKDKACLDAEKTRTKANHTKNVDDMQECKRNCYNEGSGSGGR